MDESVKWSKADTFSYEVNQKVKNYSIQQYVGISWKNIKRASKRLMNTEFRMCLSHKGRNKE